MGGILERRKRGGGRIGFGSGLICGVSVFLLGRLDGWVRSVG